MYTCACCVAKLGAIAIWTAAVLCAVPRAHASDLDLRWSAPPDCSDREHLREALSRKLGREVTLGSDAALAMSGSVAAESGGYELTLETRSPNGSEQRRLQARSCGELVRASLLIAVLLLGEGGSWSEAAHAPQEDQPRSWSWTARLRGVLDLGSIAAVSAGIGGAVGMAFKPVRFELGALWLPPRSVHSDAEPDARGQLHLLTASAAVCHEFFAGPTLAPCVDFELGRLHAEGVDLQHSKAVSTAWLLAGFELRGNVRLFDSTFLSADAGAGFPLERPTFGVRGAGPVYRVPAVVGRFGLGLEMRF